MIIRNGVRHNISNLGSSGNGTIIELTQDEYNALPESKNTDGVLYAITDGDEFVELNFSDMVEGKNTKIIACVARYLNGEWTLLNDDGHVPLNVKSIETLSSGSFRIHHNFDAKKVLSLVCGVDETYAINGFNCGASVGLSNSVINVSKIDNKTSVISCTNGVYSSTDSSISVTVQNHATLGNYLRLEHENIPGVIGLNSATEYDWKLLGMTGNYANVQPFKNGAKASLPLPEGKCNFYYQKGSYFTSNITSHPSGSNIWIYGIFEV